MTDEQLVQAVADLERFEGRVAWLYNDSATPPNRTIGIGFLVANVTAACRLPFVNRSADRHATFTEIGADFARVSAMPGDMASLHYRAPDGTAVIELGDDDITGLAVSKLRDVFVPGLLALCPGFDGFPGSAQSALIDMAWNLGLRGLHGFPAMLTACNRGDWATAAEQSHVATSRDDRNAWRAAQFRAAR